jgi:hypothetical protein
MTLRIPSYNGYKLTVENYHAIIARCAKGEVHRRIAKDFNVSREYVRLLNNAAGLPLRADIRRKQQEERDMERAQVVADRLQDKANTRLMRAQAVAAHLRSGRPRAELSAMLGLKPTSVDSRIAWLKLRYPDLFSFLIPYAKHTVYANEPPVHHGDAK